ncbi:MAG TPA: hypothetical protein ENI85_14220 [Deltaproteobacteria bacterium]|nr:hypothetical protein [Deltaproteobacteria bacterium]
MTTPDTRDETPRARRPPAEVSRRRCPPRIETLDGDASRIKALVQTRLGRAAASIEPIDAGLGTRRFYRVHLHEGEPQSVIARVEPEGTPQPRADALLAEAPTWLPEPRLEPIRGFLEAGGLPVPRCPVHCPEDGIDLLEDVGTRTLAMTGGAERRACYREACSLIPRLQRLHAPADRVPAFGRIYDRALVGTKAWKWLHWTIPGLLGRQPRPDETREIHALFEKIARLLESAPRRLAHRDFKAENLHLRTGSPEADPRGPEDAGTRLVMIDFQGAFLAPPEYDLACLLVDMQVDLDEQLVQTCLDETRPALPDAPDPETFALRFDGIALLRLCKDLSHVIHAAVARNDPRRFHEVPRGLALLEGTVGRLEHTFPEIRTLTSVIHALTAAAHSSDSPSQGRAE